ncbi:Ran GTPase-activating protein [Phaffia rhodozyma]|uniref:Ran GTPase-activating protein n=1 Tax=Phaffia rhodozyma TaxID=264483 RepID=A0A0F7SKB3_PHARH|nr:Ran GTPase-activating protein [Phaffia rhodozyma]
MSISFSLKGQGLKLTSAQDAQPHIDALVALGPDVQEIHLGGNTLGIEASKAFAEVFKGLHKLKVADFADIFTGRLISEIPEALSALCDSLAHTTSLETLDLSDNAFGGRCAEPIVPFLKTNLNVSHFILNNNGLGPTGGNIIAQALLDSANASEAKGQRSALRTFVCGRNRLENGTADLLAKAFAAHGLLQVVRLPQNGIRMEGIQAISKGLAQNPELAKLDLQDNTMTLKGSRAVAQALPSWPKLKELNLSDCLLGRRGGLILTTALANGSNKELESVKIQYGEMDSRSFVQLATAIKLHLSSLTQLELNGNIVDPEDESVEKIKDALDSHGHQDALDELDDMEEDEGEDEEEDEEEEEEEDEEEEEKEDEEKDADKGTKQQEEKDTEVPSQPSILDMSVDAMADALSKMSVIPPTSASNSVDPKSSSS